jgi:predicted nucleotidyltransferase component of viral defense system
MSLTDSLNEIRKAYTNDGLNYLDASACTCQDVVLRLIAKSSLAKNVTIKGGVVMQHLSNDLRRATQDLDLDFIRYSISDDSIKAFISKLNNVSSDFSIELFGSIEELKHQDYNGKRVYIKITDKHGTSIDTKLDIGVHKDLAFSQTEYCFDLYKQNSNVTLLANTKEQIITEKLKSLLRFGALSTRYKDIFDMYYLVLIRGVSDTLLLRGIKSSIFNDKTMRETSLQDICTRLNTVFANSRFISHLRNSKKNWLDIDAQTATTKLLDYFKALCKGLSQ